MDLTKDDNQMAKGIAILGMVMLHLFCRLGEFPYEPLVFLKNGRPLVYYFGLFGDLCVPTYCFCSGFAQMVLKEREQEKYFRKSLIRLLKFIVNFWIVLIVFSLVGLLFGKDGTIPGTFGKFLGNFFLFRLSYNGAWWFVLTYVFLILSSPFLIKMVKQLSSGLVFFGGGILYFLAYMLRFKYEIEIDRPVFSWVYTQALLFGTSQFSFLVGMLFQKHQIIRQLRAGVSHSRLKKILCFLIPVGMFCFHAIVPSLIIAPVTGLSAIACFHLAEKPKWIQKIFLFLGHHSTNIWLVHMFFYLVLFENFVFIAKYPLFIFLLMFAICIAVSFGINIIYQPVLQLFGKKGFLCQKSA